jgi:T5SS/PEP-CTERM-associated repeat protein
VYIEGEGAAWNNNGDVSIGVGGTGLLSMADGGEFTSAGLLTVSSHGMLRGNGTAAANVLNAGVIAPGNPVGNLSIEGDYSQTNAGTLRIELNGVASGQFGSLNVTGTATLNGTLGVTLGENNGVPYAPQLGHTFTILSAAEGLTGQFSALQFPELSAGRSWLVGYNGNSVTLAVASSAGVAGDYNRDGVVDAADYVVWRKSSVTGNLIGDGNGDSMVNAADYGVWRTAFSQRSIGSSFASSSRLPAIPEPTSLAIAAAAAMFHLTWRRRRARV